MGKKSKAKAKAGGGSSTKALPSPSSSSSGRSPSAGTSIGGNVEAAAGKGKQKLKCIRCLANIKDADKARACPGCSDIYCWRCEKKDFGECSRGADCVRPVRRCERCRWGKTLTALRSTDHVKESEARTNSFETRVDALPMRLCHTKGCHVWECCPCADRVGSKKALRVCCRCFKAQCAVCLTKSKNEECRVIINPMQNMMRNDVPLTTAHFDSFAATLRSDLPDLMAPCDGCGVDFCFKCADHIHLVSVVKGIEEKLRVGKSKSPVRCPTCYYKAKPCTNPTCPNEVGISTKRCGGCHIDRYCSVECQAAAYPGHVERCKKIQEKRAGAKC